jgi:hypothetical protein
MQQNQRWALYYIRGGSIQAFTNHVKKQAGRSNLNKHQTAP